MEAPIDDFIGTGFGFTENDPLRPVNFGQWRPGRWNSPIFSGLKSFRGEVDDYRTESGDVQMPRWTRSDQRRW